MLLPQNILTPMLEQLSELGEMDETQAPTKRLAIIQVGRANESKNIACVALECCSLLLCCASAVVCVCVCSHVPNHDKLHMLCRCWFPSKSLSCYDPPVRCRCWCASSSTCWTPTPHGTRASRTRKMRHLPCLDQNGEMFKLFSLAFSSLLLWY